MKVKMLRDEKGSIDGFTVNIYKAGSTVDLPEDLAEAFISIGAAEAVKENRIEPEVIETPEKQEFVEDEPVVEEVVEAVSIKAPESQDIMDAVVKKIPEQPKKAWRKS